jgi:CRP/FNR family cyclic AMP-dependent transcriptional regulator
VESSLLRVLSEPDRRELLAIARRRKFARGEVIFHEGDPGDTMHLIAKGHVAVRVTTPLGEVAMLRIIPAGAFFGELALITPGPRNATISALDPVETLCIHTNDFTELRTRHPAVERVLTHALVAEVRRLSTALSESLYLSADKRVLRRLLEAAALFGTDAEPATVVPLTQEELGQLAGVARPTVNRTLRAAEDNAFLRVSRGQVEILDPAALAHQAR